MKPTPTGRGFSAEGVWFRALAMRESSLRREDWSRPEAMKPIPPD